MDYNIKIAQAKECAWAKGVSEIKTHSSFR
jgi:hypothetical protein